MKSYKIFLIIAGCAYLKVNAAQAFHIKNTHPIHLKVINKMQLPDTDKYLRDNFINKKEQFKHKSLNDLLAQLHLTVKSYALGGKDKPGGPYKNLALYFEDAVLVSNKKKVSFLSINFEEDIPAKAIVLYMKGDGNWLQAEKDYYGKMIIKDIRGLKDPKSISPQKTGDGTSGGKVIRM